MNINVRNRNMRVNSGLCDKLDHKSKLKLGDGLASNAVGSKVMKLSHQGLGLGLSLGNSSYIIFMISGTERQFYKEYDTPAPLVATKEVYFVTIISKVGLMSSTVKTCILPTLCPKINFH